MAEVALLEVSVGTAAIGAALIAYLKRAKKKSRQFILRSSGGFLK